MIEQAHLKDLPQDTLEDEGKHQEAMIENIDDVKLILNQNNSKIILNMHKNGETPDKISYLTLIPIEIVNLVIDICDLSTSYLQYCEENDEDPDYETFMNEAKNRFKNVSQEVIDLIT